MSTTPFGRVLVLHTTGRRSGQPRKTPLSYTNDGDTYVVIASDGGSHHHPDWYLNLPLEADTYAPRNRRYPHQPGSRLMSTDRGYV